jgi:hypothetical protein
MFPLPQVWKQQNVHRGELKSVDAVLLPDRLRMLTFGIRARYMPYPSEQKTGKGSRDDSKVPDNLQDIHVRMDAMYASGNAGTLPLKMGEMSHFGVVFQKWR